MISAQIVDPSIMKASKYPLAFRISRVPFNSALDFLRNSGKFYMA
jgi:hypothetical protein